MDIEEKRMKISNETGIPLRLLTGETVEDIQIRAAALMAYKNGSGEPEDVLAKAMKLKTPEEVAEYEKQIAKAPTAREAFAIWAKSHL